MLEFLKFIGVTAAYIESPEAVAEMAPVLDMLLRQQCRKLKKKRDPEQCEALYGILKV
jgi:hypothetical protein